MARPEKNNVEYFPHTCKHGRKMFVIESKYGNDGYAVWFKLLEQLGDAEFHYLDLREPTQLMFLSSVMKVDEDRLKSILKDLATLGAIDFDMYVEHSIVWSQKLIDSLDDAYLRRNNNCIQLESLCKHLSIKQLHKPTNGELMYDSNTQTKVKKSKLEEIKGKETLSKEGETIKYLISKNLGITDMMPQQIERLHRYIAIMELRKEIDYFITEVNSFFKNTKAQYWGKLNTFLGDEGMINGRWNEPKLNPVKKNLTNEEWKIMEKKILEKD